MFRLALHNLLIHRARTSLAVAGLCVAMVGIVVLTAFSSGIQAVMADTLSLLPGVMAMRKGVPNPVLSTLPASHRATLEQVDGVEAAVAQVFFPATDVNGRNVLLAGDMFNLYLVVGVDCAAVAALEGGGLFSRSLKSGRMPLDGTQEVAVPRAAIEAFGCEVGKPITVLGHELQVVGVFEVGTLLLDRGFVVSLDVAQKIGMRPVDQVSAFYLELEPGADAKAVARAVEQAAPDVRARTTEETSGDFSHLWREVDLMLAAIAAVAVLIGALGIINTMLMSVLERTSEFGVLAATGWTRFDLVRLVLVESALLGSLGGLAGCVLGLGCVQLASLALPLEPQASFAMICTCVALAVVLGTLGGVYPAWRVGRIDPVHAIRFGSAP